MLDVLDTLEELQVGTPVNPDNLNIGGMLDVLDTLEQLQVVPVDQDDQHERQKADYRTAQQSLVGTQPLHGQVQVPPGDPAVARFVRIEIDSLVTGIAKI